MEYSGLVISGAYSVSRQAMRLGLLPRLLVRHTSKVEGGQIYVPAINLVLYVPLLIAGAVLCIMTTWRRGYAETTRLRIDREGSVADFVQEMKAHPVPQIPGVAVFPHHDSPTAPLALRANVEFNRVLHEHVVIVSLADENVPHVPPSQRVTVEDLGDGHGGIVHVICRIGFNDSQDVPEALALAVATNPELDVKPRERSLLPVDHEPRAGRWPALRARTPVRLPRACAQSGQ